MLTRRFLTMKEVAEPVQVSEASIRHRITLRQPRASDHGRAWRAIPRDLEDFLAARHTRRAPHHADGTGRGPAGGAAPGSAAAEATRPARGC